MMNIRDSRWLCAFLVVAAGCGGGGTGNSTSAGSAIVYSFQTGVGANFDVDSVTPTGTRLSPLASNVPNTTCSFAPDPASSGTFVLASLQVPPDRYGLYITHGLSLIGATQLVAPTYGFVGSITVTANGRYVVYTVPGSLYVIPISGGTPLNYGPSEGSTVSPADSDTIAYLAPVGSSGADQIFTRSLAAGPSGATTQITTDAPNHFSPAFSPDGTKLAFVEETKLQDGTDLAFSDTLVVDSLSTGTMTPMPNPSKMQIGSVVFSADGSTLVFGGLLNAQYGLFTQSANGSAPPSPLLNTITAPGSLFWTN